MNSVSDPILKTTDQFAGTESVPDLTQKKYGLHPTYVSPTGYTILKPDLGLSQGPIPSLRNVSKVHTEVSFKIKYTSSFDGHRPNTNAARCWPKLTASSVNGDG